MTGCKSVEESWHMRGLPLGRMTEDGSVAQFCTYARIDTVVVPMTGDLMNAWENPASFFLMDGAKTSQNTASN
jgi:hypothetical protein